MNLDAKIASSSENYAEGEADVEMARSDGEGKPFQCSICWELVYKPVVHACGHIFCFWCVHFAMSRSSDSQCPICRRTYGHFPRVCEMLHFLLLEILPDDYRCREREVQDMEVEMELSSPQLGEAFPPEAKESTVSVCVLPSELLPVDSLSGSDGILERISFTDVETSTVGTDPATNRDTKLTSTVSASNHANIESDGTDIAITQNNSSEICVDSKNVLNSEVYHKGQFVEQIQGAHQVESFPTDNCTCERLCDALPGGVGSSQSLYHASVSNVLCKFCHQLLCRPVVLVCGHAFCQVCIPSTEDGRSICSSCQSLHPEQYAEVCLELHFYLERTFSTKYKQRLKALDSAKSPTQIAITKPHLKNKDYEQQKPAANRGLPNVGIGCDGCGMFPIYGTLFHCEDCPSIGYDLCESCYKADHDLPGRFNQHHTKEHHMVEIALRSTPFQEHEYVGLYLVMESVDDIE